MKEILAFIRENKVFQTKAALEEAGFPAFTCRKVFGRGKKPVDFLTYDNTAMGAKMFAKRAFTLIVNDNEVEKVVKVFMNTNSTGNPGDGKIFVIPIIESYRVSTGEGGADAY